MTGRGSRYDEDDPDSDPYVSGLDDEPEDWVDPYSPPDDDSFFADAETDAEEDDPRSAWRRSPWPLAGTILTLLLVVSLVIGRNTEIFSNPNRTATVPVVPPSGLVYCDGVLDTDRARIEWATTEMQGVDEGKTLFDRLVDMDLCIATEDLPYNAGYTSVRSNGREWIVDKIVLSTNVIRRLDPDELAALLVHEATHADRVARGESCYQTGSCTALANGVAVDEEVAAHAAEASFWIALHGSTGKRGNATLTGGWGAAWENALAAAYQKGPDALRDFVIDARSDAREGEGINP